MPAAIPFPITLKNYTGDHVNASGFVSGGLSPDLVGRHFLIRPTLSMGFRIDLVMLIPGMSSSHDNATPALTNDALFL